MALEDTGADYALPVASVVDAGKLKGASDEALQELAEQLLQFLHAQHGVLATTARIIEGPDALWLVFNAVPEHSLPALLALADVQGTTLHRYQKLDAQGVQLTPLAVRPGE